MLDTHFSLKMSGLDAARRKFPSSLGVIESLIMHDADFRGLCDDLAAAEAAMKRLDALPPTIRAERLAECSDWIELLSGEIEKAMQRAKVVPLTARRRR